MRSWFPNFLVCTIQTSHLSFRFREKGVLWAKNISDGNVLAI